MPPIMSRAVVERDRDHPSIVAWVPENESFGLQDVDDATRGRLLLELYHLTGRLDGTRPVVSNDGERHAKTDLCTRHDYRAPDLLARRLRSLEVAIDPDAGRPQPPNLPRYGHRGEPALVSEFGGVRLSHSGGWAYGEVKGLAQLLETYRAQVEALLDPGPVEGFCYTQLTDVEQERNRLLTSVGAPRRSLLCSAR